MRAPERIPPFMWALEALWLANPDMRFGQLVMNLKRPAAFTDTWEWEDGEWLRRIDAFYQTGSSDPNQTGGEVSERLSVSDLAEQIAAAIGFGQSTSSVLDKAYAALDELQERAEASERTAAGVPHELTPPDWRRREPHTPRP